jgi:hypothetical protein
MTNPDAYHDALRDRLRHWEAQQHAAEEAGDDAGAETAERRRYRLSGLLGELASRRNAFLERQRDAEDERRGYRD